MSMKYGIFYISLVQKNLRITLLVGICCHGMLSIWRVIRIFSIL